MSLVLLAAPLSGLVVQPIIGHRADYSKSRYGRRRPYMFVGSIVAGLSMLLLGYGKPAVELVFGADSKLASS
jgi:solute carrier family 45 protein 1/2/4